MQHICKKLILNLLSFFLFTPLYVQTAVEDDDIHLNAVILDVISNDGFFKDAESGVRIDVQMLMANGVCPVGVLLLNSGSVPLVIAGKTFCF